VADQGKCPPRLLPLFFFSASTYFRFLPARFRQDLENIARTTLSSKILHTDKDHFSKLCVDAILRLKVPSFLCTLFLFFFFCFAFFFSPNLFEAAGKPQPRCDSHHQENWRISSRLVLG
jgi:hypothetical protein